MKNEKEYFNREGHLTDTSVCISADGLNDEREDNIPDEIRSHLEECESCRNVVMDIYSTTIVMAEKKAPVPAMFSAAEPVRRPLLFSPALRTAATLLILTFAAAIYLVVDSRGPAKKFPTISPDQSTSITPVSTDIEKNTGNKISGEKRGPEQKGITRPPARNPFKDNPNLETMVNSRHRGRMIHIISPEYRELENGKIIFQWENHIDKHLILKILNNKNETVFRSKATGSSVEFTGNLRPGLYYWKLEDSENLYHVGKFIIKK